MMEHSFLLLADCVRTIVYCTYDTAFPLQRGETIKTLETASSFRYSVFGIQKSRVQLAKEHGRVGEDHMADAFKDSAGAKQTTGKRGREAGMSAGQSPFAPHLVN